jgi:hypothetical protein
MNYFEIYNKLVETRRNLNRKKIKNGAYYESHHIVPRCLGGSDTKSNLVLLTAKEHFVAHRLLCEMYPNNSKLVHAFWMMMNTEGRGQVRHKVSSRIYESIRILHQEIRRRSFTENNPMKNEDSIGRNVKARKGIVKRPDLTKQNRDLVTCPHCDKVGANNSMKRWHFDNCKVFTGVQKKHPQIECPHCGHTSQPMIISKYHLDNCKKAPALSKNFRDGH